MDSAPPPRPAPTPAAGGDDASSTKTGQGTAGEIATFRQEATKLSHFRRFYFFVFSFFYLIQGFVQGMSYLYAIYIADLFGGYDIALNLLIISTGTLPWTVKFVVGFINDKWGSKRLGRRFPFILGFGLWGGTWTLLMTAFIPTTEAAMYPYFMFFNVMINVGMAFADTALDGLILDVTPKAKLGKVQSFTWSLLLAGSGLGLVVVLLIGQFLRPVQYFPTLFVIVGLCLVVTCILPYWVKEEPVNPDVHLGAELKRIFGQPRNYAVFVYTLVAAIAPIMVLKIYEYYILISIDVISVEETRLALLAGESIDLLEWEAVFLAVNGVGIVLGSLLAGAIADKKRRALAVHVAYALFVPFCLVSNFFVGLVLGIVGHVIYGVAEGTRSISGQTIRGDLAQHKFPNAKSTYYAILVGMINLGQTISSLLGAWIFAVLAGEFETFDALYFWVTCIAAAILLASYLVFKLIPREDYEFAKGVFARPDAAGAKAAGTAPGKPGGETGNDGKDHGEIG